MRNNKNNVQNYKTWKKGRFGNDRLKGDANDNKIMGDPPLFSNDFDSEGYLLRTMPKRFGNDRLNGRDGDDWLQDQLGRDRYRGGEGDDVLVSISDSNVPAENRKIQANVDDGNDVDKLSFARKFYNPDNLASNDRMRGGTGADTFKFDLLINAPEEIYTKHINSDGTINWGMNGVAGENDNYHDHWVEGIGRDTIVDFSGTGGEGDQIVITGHTVQYKVIQESNNQVKLGVYSDQGADGVRGGGAHDMDVLGVINVKHDGNFDLDKDVTLVHEDLGSFATATGRKVDNPDAEPEEDSLMGSLGSERLVGNSNDNKIYGDPMLTAEDFNRKGYLSQQAIDQHGNDRLLGRDGDDILQDQLGRDRYKGGKGDDVLISISDSNVPAENKQIKANVDDGNDVDKLSFSKEFYNPDDLAANDRLTGGAGADTFKFDLLINAPEEIYTQHMDSDGLINWGMNGVAGENNNYHDHWVEGIGRDVITDFSGTGGEGDKIVLTGHTVEYKVIKELNRQIVLGVYSDQGADGVRGGGAHDLDVLGVIKVRHDGNFNLANDVSVVHQDLGAF